MANEALYGLQSFDSSVHGGPGGVTAGNAHLTFGTMADSFDESREDAVRSASNAANRGAGTSKNVLDGIREEEGWGNSIASASVSRSINNNNNNNSTPTAEDSTRQEERSNDTMAASSTRNEEAIIDELEDPGAWVEKQRRAKSTRKTAGTAANDSTVTNEETHGQMTLREQEKVIDELKKENFSLKLKIHFYSQRLEQLAPSHIDAALRENVQLKVEFQTLRTELKRYKKLLLEGNKAIEAVMRERDEARRQVRTGGSGSARGQATTELEARLAETERKWKEEREKRRKLRDSLGSDDLQAEVEHLNAELDQLRDAHEEALGEADDLRRELRNLQDGYGDASVAPGISRRLQELEQDNAALRSQLSKQLSALSSRNIENDALKEDVEALKVELEKVVDELERLERIRDREQSNRDAAHLEKSREELEGENDHYRERLSAAEMRITSLESELEEKEKEIEELLQDLENRDADHAEALKAAEDEWAAEIDDLRAREAEARDLLEEKDHDVVELAERVELLARELDHERADRAADAEEVAALTDDLKKLGAQIFALEEEAEDKDVRIRDLVSQVEAAEHRSSELDRAHAEIEHLRIQTDRQDSDVRRLGQSHSSDRQAMQDEVDRLTREIRRLQSELAVSRDGQEARAREEADFREIERRLADETQSRLNATEKLDAKTKQLANTQAELAELKDKLRALEIQLKSEGRVRARVGTASPGPSDSPSRETPSAASSAAQIALLTTRASDAERRLAATQAQLADAENKLGEARTKVGIAEGKWEARLRELEARLKASEEKVKRERQGAKERVAELNDTIRDLEDQVQGAKRRDVQLGQVMQRAGSDKTNRINSRNPFGSN